MTFQGPKDKNEEHVNYLAYANTPLKTNESPLKNDSSDSKSPRIRSWSAGNLTKTPHSTSWATATFKS